MIQKHSNSQQNLNLKSTNPTKTRNVSCVFSTNTDINKLNWRFNHIFFSDHKPGLLLYAGSTFGLKTLRADI